VAELAFNSQGPYVMLMAERDRLLAGQVLQHFVRRTHHQKANPKSKCHTGDQTQQTESEDRVGNRTKRFWHQPLAWINLTLALTSTSRYAVMRPRSKNIVSKSAAVR
jgi:hypothetical protein